MDALDGREARYPFPDTVFVQDRRSAIQYSREMFKQGNLDRCLVLWVDGSVEAPNFPPRERVTRVSVSAVSYLDPCSKGWKDHFTFNLLPVGSQFAAEAEFIAIHEAFRIACSFKDSVDRLVIFSDCKRVLQGMEDGSRFSFLRKKEMLGSLLAFASCLYDVGIVAELRWVPAHAGVEGNERVDKLARQLRRGGQSILAQASPLRILSNMTVALGPFASLRQALVEDMLHTPDETESNRTERNRTETESNSNEAESNSNETESNSNETESNSNDTESNSNETGRSFSGNAA